jgi:TrpR-related protein YerC/YecD
MNQQISERDMNLLCSALLVLETKNEVKKFLTDITSPTELTHIVERLKIAQRVLKGTPYRTIAKNLNCSTTTVSKVAAKVLHGSGGLQKGISRLSAD